MDIPMAEFLLARYVSHASRRRPVAPLPASGAAHMRRVLLVLTTGIGDAVLSSAVIPSLRAALPRAQIRLFCRAACTELFAADPQLDGLIPYHGKFRRFRATLRELRAFAPDLAVVLHGNDPDILPLCYLAGSKHIVRVPTTGTRFAFLLSNRARGADAATVPGLHYVDNRLRVLDTLGIPVTTRAPAIHLDPDVRLRVRARLATQLSGRPYWVLHARAADAYKSLPEPLVSEVLRHAESVLPGGTVVLTGGPAERASLERLAAGRAHVFVAAGAFSLAETASCLAEARVVVGPDTGVLHLAAALDRPVLGLYSPTRASLVGPRAAHAPARVIEKPLTCEPCYQKQCPYRPVKCMGQFSADEIVAAAGALARGSG